MRMCAAFFSHSMESDITVLRTQSWRAWSRNRPSIHWQEGTLLVEQLGEALRYKPQCCGFDSPWCHWSFFIDTILLAVLWPWSRFSLQHNCVPVIFPWGQRRPVRRAGNFTTFMCRLSWNLETSTFWNPQGLSRPLQVLFYHLLHWPIELERLRSRLIVTLLSCTKISSAKKSFASNHPTRMVMCLRNRRLVAAKSSCKWQRLIYSNCLTTCVMILVSVTWIEDWLSLSLF